MSATMRAIGGIDHCIILVRDLAAARIGWEALGFRTAPIGRHPDHMGTANHTIMLADTYLELLGVLTETEANARWRAALARREGVVAVAMRALDAEAAHAAVAGRGAAPEAVRHWGRAVQVAGAGAGEARFSTFQLRDEVTPGLRLFFCRHLTPQTTWAPGLTEHPNTAVGIERFDVVVDDPAGAAAATARLLGLAADGTTVRTTAGCFSFTSAAELAARLDRAVAPAMLPQRGIAGIAIRVRSLDLARAAVEAGGIRPAVLPEAVIVPPGVANGVVVTFIRA
ncbi:VOC family protein [Elioraea sp. Yellowstone]|uniref:VOC family protein n=1 Tax=Elioraea sp. Yellowstone TaxID=2592070 RepID=UPI0011510CB7|nr:VOC family protein [Elioraea sp. Yellowstone]TQF83433.1 VOC family protein [Elioraea sp. Yellowstone]